MPVAGSDQPWVIDHERALLEADTLGERVVILDAIGHIEAIGVGHYLAERGHQVTVVTPLHSPLLLDAETMQKALPRAVRAGVRWRPNTAVVSIGEHEVMVADVMSYAVETLPADHVVIRTHGVANDALYHALLGRLPNVRRVGDAIVPRLADRAISDGHLAARAI
jgi:pyruvate/2-oxoglutarate dehydrogenase complex dihydrolipoamide dehydrogenase (E3) component